MEDQWFWWELLLLIRKIAIMACGSLNTSNPSRGWYLASAVIVVSLSAHSFARPFKDPWVDMTEFVSLLSTLMIFQGGMVWTVDPEGALATIIERLSIVLVLLTCLMAFIAEARVYKRRHGHHAGGTSAAQFDNPMAMDDSDAVDDIRDAVVGQVIE